MQCTSVRNNCKVTSYFHYLCNTNRNNHFRKIARHLFFLAVTVQTLNNQRRIVSFQQIIVHPRGLCHVPWNTHHHSANTANDSTHRASAVPNTFQSVTACAYNCWSHLSTSRSVTHASQVVAHNLKRVIDVI